MSSFVIVNSCSDPDLTADKLAAIASALQVHLNRDFASWWGGSYRVRGATPDNPPAAGEVVGVVLDDLPEAPGALAYHDWQGKPDIYAARNMCTTLTSGLWSLSQGLGHELDEVWDYACNRWADDGAGNSIAMETCDPVESAWYEIDGIAVPDFVTPAWFNPGDTSGQYSYMRSTPAPFTIAPGSYFLQRTAGSDIVNVQGTIHEMRRPKKRHWSSRTWRRGARLSA